MTNEEFIFATSDGGIQIYYVDANTFATIEKPSSSSTNLVTAIAWSLFSCAPIYHLTNYSTTGRTTI